MCYSECLRCGPAKQLCTLNNFFVNVAIKRTPSVTSCPAVLEPTNVCPPRRRRLQRHFFTGHTWFNVIARYRSSKFTRAQRVTCALFVILSGMMFNVMYHDVDTSSDSEHLSLFEVPVHLNEFLLGLQVHTFPALKLKMTSRWAADICAASETTQKKADTHAHNLFYRPVDKGIWQRTERDYSSGQYAIAVCSYARHPQTGHITST